MTRCAQAVKAVLLLAATLALTAPGTNAFAQSVNTYGSTLVSVPGTAQALGPQGQVLGYTSVDPGSFASNFGANYVYLGCYSGLCNTGTSLSYYITGAQGGSALGSGPTQNLGTTAIYPSSSDTAGETFESNHNGFVFSNTVFDTGSYTNTNLGPSTTAFSAGASALNLVGSNGSGTIIAANTTSLDTVTGPDGLAKTYYSNLGAIVNNGTLTYLLPTASSSSAYPYLSTTITGINESGSVAFTADSGASASTGYILNQGAITPIALANLGYGMTTGQINAANQVTGSMGVGGGVTEAFRTTANGSDQLLGLGGGVSSSGLALNDTGQVGGYVTEANGSTEAFITTTKGLMVGLGSSAIGADSTKTLFVNDAGNAIVEDTDTNKYYYYSDGYLTQVNVFDGNDATDKDPVVGLNNQGDILFQDPDLVKVVGDGNIAALPGSQSIMGSTSFDHIVEGTGTAPDSGFFSNPEGPTPGSGTLGGLTFTSLTSNSAGESGGYVNINGQNVAYIADINNTGAIGISVDYTWNAATGTWVATPTDNTETLFLSNSGMAVIEDTTDGEYYYYQGGIYLPVESLDASDITNTDQVLGFTSGGALMVLDSGVEHTIQVDEYTTQDVWDDFHTSQEVSLSAGYYAMENAIQKTPTTAFFNAPTNPAYPDFVAYDPGSTYDPVYAAAHETAVPEPGMFGLAGLGAALMGRRRRRLKASVTGLMGDNPEPSTF